MSSIIDLNQIKNCAFDTREPFFYIFSIFFHFKEMDNSKNIANLVVWGSERKWSYSVMWFSFNLNSDRERFDLTDSGSEFQSRIDEG